MTVRTVRLPEQLPEALLADRGYDADAIRVNLACRNVQAVIPDRSNRRVKINHDRALYKQRNRIEPMFAISKSTELSPPATTNSPIAS